MENASKALLMAAGFVMGIAVLSLAVYLYASFGGSAKTINQNIEEGNRNQFNNQYIEYTVKDCNVYDIYSVVNLANDYNKTNEFTKPSNYSSTDYYIWVDVKIGSTQTTVNSFNESHLKQLLTGKTIGNMEAGKSAFDSTYAYYSNTNVYKLYKFSASVEYNEWTGRVNRITFVIKE